MAHAPRDYPDLHQHLEELKKRGLLQVVDRPIDKDSELHPLVRWQFIGGLDEPEYTAVAPDAVEAFLLDYLHRIVFFRLFGSEKPELGLYLLVCFHPTTIIFAGLFLEG